MRWSLLLLIVLMATMGCASKTLQTNSDLVAEQKVREDLRHRYEKGETLYKLGKLEESKVQFAAMLDLQKDEPNANYRLGTIAFKQGQFEISAAYFETVIGKEPKNYKAHYNLAAIRLMQAENHFKYYAALVDPDTDLSKVSELIADIDRFNSKRVSQGGTHSLDKLATSLKK